MIKSQQVGINRFLLAEALDPADGLLHFGAVGWYIDENDVGAAMM